MFQKSLTAGWVMLVYLRRWRKELGSTSTSKVRGPRRLLVDLNRLVFLHTTASMLSRIARRAITRPSLQRNVHISSYTVEYPTPESLSSLLKDRDASSHLFYTLSTSIPETSLSPLLKVLQSEPSPSNSVGSFHLSRIPTVSVAILTPEEGESISTFYTPASGRGHAEVRLRPCSLLCSTWVQS